ncbi:MAG TPA: DUF4118 domain-containing protein [Thiolinea sp.]|nr:DUF4118 domain-containing protein [Thiolinea sp.]
MNLHLLSWFSLDSLVTRPRWQRYLLALLAVGCTIVIAIPLSNYLDLTNIVMLFLLSVVFVSVKLGRRPAILAAFTSVLAFNFFFVPPYWSLEIAHIQYLITLVAMLVVALTITHFMSDFREQANTALTREQQTLELYRLEKLAQENQMQMATERLRSSILSALSHDIRTPLTSLYGLAESLQLTTNNLDANTQATLIALRDQASHINNMVNNLLEMARLQAGGLQFRKEWQPIDEVIGTSIKLLKPALTQHTVKVDIPEDFPLLEFDALLMERVFCNLLENAAKYSPPRSTLSIHAKLLSDRDQAEVSLCNEGEGFPADKLEQVFELFERGRHESTIPGVGLGLSICRAIIEAHGGSIKVANQATGGSCTYFYLPLGHPPTMFSEAPSNGVA